MGVTETQGRGLVLWLYCEGLLPACLMGVTFPPPGPILICFCLMNSIGSTLMALKIHATTTNPQADGSGLSTQGLLLSGLRPGTGSEFQTALTSGTSLRT